MLSSVRRLRAVHLPPAPVTVQAWAVEVRLLGPVELAVLGAAVHVGPPQRCAVLASLAVDAGRTVPVETVIDRVWGESGPDGVRRALHAHLARLRRLLEGAGRPAALVRRPGGYLLDVAADSVDVHRFRRLLDEAHQPDCDATQRAAVLRTALDLWRGNPLGGVG